MYQVKKNGLVGSVYTGCHNLVRWKIVDYRNHKTIDGTDCHSSEVISYEDAIIKVNTIMDNYKENNFDLKINGIQSTSDY
jgi:hypothetical protein